MLLLLNQGAIGRIGVTAAVLALSAPDATLVVGEVLLQPTPCVLEISATAPTLEARLQPTAAVLALSGPTPTLGAGPITLQPSPAVVALSTGAAGVAVDVTVPIFLIGGVARGDVLRSSVTISDELDEAPNACTFEVEDSAPVVGQEIKLSLGSLLNLEFGGHIVSVEQVYISSPEVRRWRCEATDYTRLLDRRNVLRRYGAQSASTVVLDILAKDTSGFSSAGVVPGLPSIEQIDFDEEPVSRALTRIAKLIGGYWYVDYARVVHFFLTETVDAPADITDANLEVRGLARASDINQIRTKVVVEGYGSTAASDVAAGAAVLPVDDAVYYASGGGLVKVGPQRVAYGGKVDGGGGTTVRSWDGPSVGAPSAAIIGGGGGVLGAVSYKVTLRNDAGETVPGSASNSVTGIAFGSGGGYGTPSVGATSGVGRIVGTRSYRTTFLNALGETTVMGGTGSATFAQHAAPSAPTVGQASGLGHLVGLLNYVVTNLTEFGETTPSAAGSRTASTLAAPANSPTPSQTASVIGAIRPGAYQWSVTHETAQGETVVGPTAGIFGGIVTWTPGGTTFNSVTAAGTGSVQPGNNYRWATAYVDQWGGVSNLGSDTGNINIAAGGAVSVKVNIPLGPTGTVARRIYRYDNYPFGAGWKFVGEAPDNLTTTFDDDVRYTGAAFAGGTMGGQATVQVPAVPSGVGITLSRIYRSKVGTSSPLYLVGEVPASTSGPQNFIDNVPDSALATLAPTTNTAGGQRHQLTIPLGPTGTLGRNIYRTAGGGAQYFLIGTLNDNVTTAWIDDVPDSALTGASPPLVNTAGGQNAAITGIPTGPPGTLARNVYRSKATGTGWFLAAQIPDNVTTTLVDSKIDDELGDGIPLSNTAGASVVQVSSLPLGPPGITSRRVYRTEGGGTLFRFVAEIRDNVTTTLIDGLSDAELGDVAPTVGTLGASAGDVVLRVEAVAPFRSGGGWAYVGRQLIRYTGYDAGLRQLTGIPASGDGSILTTQRTGEDVLAAAMLTGIATGGTGSILYPIRSGEAVNILVEQTDAAAAAALAAVEGGDGVHEYFVSDSRLSIASATNRATAELQMFATAEQRLTFGSRDPNLHSGKNVNINVGAPTNIVGTFKIQQVTISGFDVPGKLPWRQVTASNYLYSFEHLLRRVDLGGV